MRLIKVEEANTTRAEQAEGIFISSSFFSEKPKVVLTYEADSIKEAHEFYESCDELINNVKTKKVKANIKEQIASLKQDLKDLK